MIQSALQTIVQELNAYLQNQFSTVEKKVCLGNLINDSKENQDKIIVSLVNIEQEIVNNFSNVRRPSGKDNFASERLPLNLNLSVLFTACFDDYNEALSHISNIIQFVHGKHLFNQHNTPGLDPSVERLILEVLNLDFHELQSMWSALGASYRPSVLFEFRVLAISKGIDGEILPISDVSDDIKQ